MLLWLAFAVMTALVLFSLARPLTRQPPAASPEGEADLAVYRDQLAEVEAEIGRGVITGAEAEAARAEIARRLLARAANTLAASDAVPADRPLAILRAGAIGLPLAAVAAYLALGSPWLPDQPLASRSQTSIAAANAAELVAKVEERLRAEPSDGRGWEVIGPVYLRLGRYGDARHAFEQAIKLLGETPKRLIGMAEAALLQGGGVVNADVRKMAERILALEPDRIEPRAWLALAKEQDGNVAGAIADYKAMLDAAPADAPWRGTIADRLAVVEAHAAGKPQDTPAALGAGPAPSPEGARDIAALPPAEQQAMIGRMVDGLAAKLKADGKNLDGWLRLMRALKVLSREAEAKTALADARRNFEGNAEALDAIDALARNLGLGS